MDDNEDEQKRQAHKQKKLKFQRRMMALKNKLDNDSDEDEGQEQQQQVEFQRFIDNDETLSCVNLRNGNFDENDIIVFSKAMMMTGHTTNNKTSRRIKVIDFTDNNFTDKCLIHFVENCLQNNDTIEELNFDSSLHLVTIRGFTCLGKWLGVAKSLKKLRLQYCDIDGVKLKAMVDAGFGNNQSLECLFLSYNKIGKHENGIDAMERMLKNTDSVLKEVNLSNNYFVSKGAIKVFKVLQPSTTIQILNLGYNNITDEGVVALQDLLTTTHSLKDVLLFCNQLTTVGFKSIMSGLELNKTVHSIDVSFNSKIDSCCLSLLKNLLVEKKNNVLSNIQSGGTNVLGGTAWTSTAEGHLVSFYLNLNKFGRNKMKDFETIPPSLWPFILARINSNNIEPSSSSSPQQQYTSSMLFWFIQQKPDLFQQKR